MYLWLGRSHNHTCFSKYCWANASPCFGFCLFFSLSRSTDWMDRQWTRSLEMDGLFVNIGTTKIAKKLNDYMQIFWKRTKYNIHIYLYDRRSTGWCTFPNTMWLKSYLTWIIKKNENKIQIINITYKFIYTLDGQLNAAHFQMKGDWKFTSSFKNAYNLKHKSFLNRW